MHGFGQNQGRQRPSAAANSPFGGSNFNQNQGRSAGAPTQTNFNNALNQSFGRGNGGNGQGFRTAQAFPNNNGQNNNQNRNNMGTALPPVGRQFDGVSQQLGGAVGDVAANAAFNQVFNGNRGQVQQGLNQVQQGLNQLLANPANAQGAAGLKLRVAANQIGIEQRFINQGNQPFSAVGVRDVHRDIIDIVNNDPTLAAAANGTFAPLAALKNPLPAFQTNNQQAAFITQANQTVNTLVAKSQLFFDGIRGNAGSPQAFAQQVNNFAKTADTFTRAQGGLYSARFDNELALNGTNGVAATSLAQSVLQRNQLNATAAGQLLQANIGDVAGNQRQPNGQPFAFGAVNAGA